MRTRIWSAVVVALLLTACGGGTAASPTESAAANDTGPITVALYGGAFGDAITSCIVKPFTQKTGIQVTPEVGVSSITLSKLQQQKGNPLIDVAWMDGGVSEVADSSGVVEAIDTKQLSNFSHVNPKAVYKDSAGNVFALSGGFYGFGLLYNTQKVNPAPTSWNDLWSSQYVGKVTTPDPSNAMGLPFIVTISELNHGSATDINPGLQKLKALNAISYYKTAGISENLFTSGEAVIGAGYASSAFSLADKGAPVGYAVPKEGALAGDIRVHEVKGTKHPGASLKFIDYTISKDAQSCMAQTLYTAPVNDQVTLPDKAKARMPWGASGSMANLKIPNWTQINEHRSDWSDQFNKQVLG